MNLETRERLRMPMWFWMLAGVLAGVSVQGQTGAGTVEPSARPPVATVLVAYASRTGHTETMARGVVEGVRRVPGVAVIVKTVDDVTRDELCQADGIVLGCPTFYGTIPGAMKVTLEDWSWKWKVDFTDKAGGAFATGGGVTGGKEFVVVSLLMYMLNNRMVVAGPLYRNDTTGSVWAEAGASATTGPLDPGVGEGEAEAARRLGERVARLAGKLRRAAEGEADPGPSRGAE